MSWMGHLLLLGTDTFTASFVSKVVLELWRDLSLSRRLKKRLVTFNNIYPDVNALFQFSSFHVFSTKTLIYT